MMRKVLLIALAVILASMMLVGCAAPNETADSTEPETSSEDAEATEPEAGDADVAEPAAEDDEFFVGIAFGGLDAVPTVIKGFLEEKMDALGWKYVVTNGDLDMNKYVADVESLCQQEPDMIITRPVNDTVNATVVPIADKAGIPIAFMSSMTAVEGYDYLGHIADPELIRGIPLAMWLNDYCAEHPDFFPKIGFLVGAAAIDSRGVCERTINIEDYLEVDYEKVISAEADPNWTAAGGMKVTEDWLQRYTIDELNTIVCWSDEMCVGLVQAMQAAGKDPDDYLVLSYDGLPVIEEYVKEGWIDASSGLNLEKVADVVIEVCQKFKDGKEDEIDFMTYANAIFVLDANNVGTGNYETWDYSEYVD